MRATTMSWPNRIRAPSRPSGWSAMDSASTTTGPEYHMTWARPPSLPRRLAGAISAMSVQEAGTSMPTASQYSPICRSAYRIAPGEHRQVASVPIVSPPATIWAIASGLTP
jgi:hypothetical protein